MYSITQIIIFYLKSNLCPSYCTNTSDIRYQNTNEHKISTDAGHGTSHASLYDGKFLLAYSFLLFLEALTCPFVVCKTGRWKKVGKTTKRKTRTYLVLKPLSKWTTLKTRAGSKNYSGSERRTVWQRQLGWSGWGQDPGPGSCEHSTKPSGFKRRT
jgi:hypothetical protein